METVNGKQIYKCYNCDYVDEASVFYKVIKPVFSVTKEEEKFYCCPKCGSRAIIQHNPAILTTKYFEKKEKDNVQP